MSGVDALGARSSREWIEYLRGQRWFAAKGALALDAALVGAVEVRAPSAPAFVVGLLRVKFAGGAEQSYQVFEGDFVGGIAALVARRESFTVSAGAVEGLRWTLEPVAGAPAPPLDACAVRLGSAEQSNTSFVIDDGAIVKVFRKLESGVQPDVEVTGFLTTDAHFTHTPALLATMRLEQGAAATVGGMAQVFLPGSTDAWTYTLELGRQFFHGGDRAGAASAARRLGGITRELHQALAGGGGEARGEFTAERATPADLARWANGVRASITGALDLLERQLSAGGGPLLKSVRLSQAQALLGRRERYLGWVAETIAGLGQDLGARIRVHGDYHLGQVLHTADDDFMIIDFEGEPARPLADRREKSSPLRDVAGMMRSFAYAAATLLASEGSIAGNGAATATERETKAARLERELRDGFLEGYRAAGRAAPRSADVLPSSWENALRLLALFEADKVFYELSYELNNRPDWVWIPLRGIAKLLV